MSKGDSMAEVREISRNGSDSRGCRTRLGRTRRDLAADHRLCRAADGPSGARWAVSASAGALDPELENAAANCGANPVQVFFTVTLPAAMPGVITGALLMFILAFNEFLVSLFLTDSRTVTLPSRSTTPSEA